MLFGEGFALGLLQMESMEATPIPANQLVICRSDLGAGKPRRSDADGIEGRSLDITSERIPTRVHYDEPAKLVAEDLLDSIQQTND